ncbi:MAG: hypothetical protein J0L92_11575 [Deltaproteobacteria bacterium]|nr:hypothetical protein [Deltaproteobacteria bacterium]
MKISIPEGERDDLREVFSNAEELPALLAALESTDPGPTPRQLAARLASQWTRKPPLKRVLLLLTRLASTVQSMEEGKREDLLRAFAEEVITADLDQGLELVRRAAGVSALQVAGKVDDVATDHAHCFQEVRLLSELRPVFTESPLSVAGMVVNHELKLVFGSGPRSEPTELFLALDREDLTQLRDAVDRALRKDIVLRELCATREVAILGETE